MFESNDAVSIDCSDKRDRVSIIMVGIVTRNENLCLQCLCHLPEQRGIHKEWQGE